MAYFRKRVYHKRVTKSKAKPKAELATKSYVKKLIKKAPELKCATTASFALATGNIGSIAFNIPVPTIDNGNLYGERIGGQIHVKYIDIYHRWMNPNEAEYGYVRFSVLIDKYPNDQLGQDMFEGVDNTLNDPVTYVTTGRVDQIHMPYSKNRYTVLYDTRMAFGDPASHPTLACERFVKKRLKVDRTFKFIDNGQNSITTCTPRLVILWFLEGLNSGTGGLSAFTTNFNHSYQHKVWFTDA